MHCTLTIQNSKECTKWGKKKVIKYALQILHQLFEAKNLVLCNNKCRMMQNISFQVNDKQKIASRLSQFGMGIRNQGKEPRPVYL